MFSNLKISRLVASLATVTSFVVFPLQAQDAAGKTIMVRGNVTAVGESEARKLRRRSPVFDVDVVETGAASNTQLRMVDGGLLSLKADSQLNIANYEYDASTGEGQVAMELVKGGLRSITGALNKAGTNYELNTPVASIGVRGTHFEVELVDGDLFLAVWDGAVDLTVETGTGSDTVSFGEGEDFSFGVVTEEGEVTELLEAPDNFNEGHSSDSSDEESDDGESDSDEDDSDSSSGSDDQNEDANDDSDDSSSDDSASGTEDSSDDGSNESEADGESEDSDSSSEQSDSDSESSDGSSSESTDSDGGSADSSGDGTDSGGTDGSTGSEDSGDSGATDSNTGGDDGLGSTDLSADTTAPTTDTTTDTTGGTTGDSSDISSDEFVDNDIVNDDLVPDPDDVVIRTGVAVFNQLEQQSITSSQGAVSNVQASITVDFDTARIPEGNVSFEDAGGEWFAAFNGVISSSDTLDLSVNFAAHGDNLATGDISGLLIEDATGILGNLSLSEINNPTINAGGSFLLREQ